MSSLKLTNEVIQRVTAEPTLYEELPFLLPVKESAIRIALQLQRAGCTSCHKRAMRPVMAALAGAFTRLVVDEAKKPENKLPQLRERINKIIGGSHEAVVISYQDPDKREAELSF